MLKYSKYHRANYLKKHSFQCLKYTKFEVASGFLIYAAQPILYNPKKIWLAKYIINNLDDAKFYNHEPGMPTIYGSVLGLILATNNIILIKWYIKKHGIYFNLTELYGIMATCQYNVKIIKLMLDYDIHTIYDNTIICEIIYNACCNGRKNLSNY